MPETSLQSILNNMSAGSPVNVDLKDYMSTPGANFYLIGSSALLAEDDLLGLTLSSDGVLSGTPSAGVRVIRVRAENGSFDSEADWAARTGSAVASHKIDSAQAVSDATQSPVGGAKNGDSGWDFWNTYDTSVALYGGGSMRYWYPAGSIVPATNVDVRSGFHTKNVAWNAVDSGWNIGDSFYLCYSIRCDRNRVKYLGDQFGPNPKIALLDMRVGFTNPNTNEWEAVIHFEDGGNIGGYLNAPGSNNNPWEEGGRSTAYTGSDVAYTPDVDNGANQLNGVDPGLPSGDGAGSDWTSWQQDRYRYGSLYSYRSLAGGPDNHADPIHGGLLMPWDQWVHFKHLYTVGAPGSNTSRQITWYAHHGQDWVLFNDKTWTIPVTGTPSDEFHGAGSSSPRVWEVLWFNQLAFGASPDASRPEMKRWHDGVITSLSDIPAPGFSSGNYRTADAFITLRAA
jgi:hypothetical protein